MEEDNIIDVNDLGVTLRTLLAIADSRLKQTGAKTYRIRYKYMIIGSIRVRHQSSFTNNSEYGFKPESLLPSGSDQA